MDCLSRLKPFSRKTSVFDLLTQILLACLTDPEFRPLLRICHNSSSNSIFHFVWNPFYSFLQIKHALWTHPVRPSVSACPFSTPTTVFNQIWIDKSLWPWGTSVLVSSQNVSTLPGCKCRCFYFLIPSPTSLFVYLLSGSRHLLNRFEANLDG